MFRFLVRNFLFFQLFLVEAALAERAPGFVPELGAIFVLFAALRLPPRAALPFLLPIAILRAYLFPGALLYQAWLLFAGYVLLRPLGRIFFIDRLHWQAIACAGLCVLFQFVHAVLPLAEAPEAVPFRAFQVGAALLLGPLLLLSLPLVTRSLPGTSSRSSRLSPGEA